MEKQLQFIVAILEQNVRELTRTLDEYGQSLTEKDEKIDYEKKLEQLNQINQLLKNLKNESK